MLNDVSKIFAVFYFLIRFIFDNGIITFVSSPNMNLPKNKIESLKFEWKYISLLDTYILPYKSIFCLSAHENESYISLYELWIELLID